MEVLEVDGKLDGGIETLLPKVVFFNDGVNFFLMYLLTPKYQSNAIGAGNIRISKSNC